MNYKVIILCLSLSFNALIFLAQSKSTIISNLEFRIDSLEKVLDKNSMLSERFKFELDSLISLKSDLLVENKRLKTRNNNIIEEKKKSDLYVSKLTLKRDSLVNSIIEIRQEIKNLRFNNSKIIPNDFSPSNCENQKFIDYQGQTYSLVEIEGQCWFGENLNSRHFSNGDVLEELDITKNWKNTSEPSYTFYDYNPINMNLYGKLYNGIAMRDSRNLCPVGWHVPNNNDWYFLIESSGGKSKAANKLKLKTEQYPYSNSLNVLLSGERSANGKFIKFNEVGSFWSSSLVESTDMNYGKVFYFNSPSVYEFEFSKYTCLSVRCVKD